jgi:Helix-turn-helix domain
VNPLLTPEEVAALLKLGDPSDPQSGVRAIYELCRARSKTRLPAVRVGKYLRFTEAALLAWIEANQK